MRGLHVLFLRGAKRLLTAGPAGGATDGPLRPSPDPQILARLRHLLLQRPEHPDALAHGGLSLLKHQPKKKKGTEFEDACPFTSLPPLVQSPARLSLMSHLSSSVNQSIYSATRNTQWSPPTNNQRIGLLNASVFSAAHKNLETVHKWPPSFLRKNEGGLFLKPYNSLL